MKFIAIVNWKSGVKVYGIIGANNSTEACTIFNNAFPDIKENVRIMPIDFILTPNNF